MSTYLYGGLWCKPGFFGSLRSWVRRDGNVRAVPDCAAPSVSHLGCRTANSKRFGTVPAPPIALARASPFTATDNSISLRITRLRGRRLKRAAYGAVTFPMPHAKWWNLDVNKPGPKVSQAVVSTCLKPRRVPVSPGSERAEVRTAGPLPLESASVIRCHQRCR